MRNFPIPAQGPFLGNFLSLLNGTPGLHFGASIGIYESLFRESGVVTHEALASLLKTRYKSEAVRDEVEAMWEAEASLAFGDHCNEAKSVAGNHWL